MTPQHFHFDPFISLTEGYSSHPVTLWYFTLDENPFCDNVYTKNAKQSSLPAFHLWEFVAVKSYEIVTLVSLVAKIYNNLKKCYLKFSRAQSYISKLLPLSKTQSLNYLKWQRKPRQRHFFCFKSDWNINKIPK